ncbi:MAG: alpha/beta hydrolase [Gammaproteobacteria bacterium]|nr:alpha/beta hydrolase [Gammaproteobacteria bacterium]
MARVLMVMAWLLMMNGCGGSGGDGAAAPTAAVNRMVAYGDEPLQYGQLRVPAGVGPFPLVVLIHGGCWLQSVATLDYISPLAEALTEAGWASYNIEYRSTDSSGGGWPGTFEDIAAAIDFTPMLAAAYNLDLTRLAVVGHSAGGQLALWAASRNQLPAQSVLYRPQPVVPTVAVGLAAITDLASYPQQNPSCGRPIAALVGQRPATPERLAETSPLAMGPAAAAVSLILGDRDRIVPLAQAESYQLLSPQTRLVTVSGDHFTLTNPQDEAFTALLATLEQGN